MNVVQRTALRLLHHHTDGFLIALKILLHSLEYAGLGLDTVQLTAKTLQLFPKLLCPLGAGGLPQGIACNGVI